MDFFLYICHLLVQTVKQYTCFLISEHWFTLAVDLAFKIVLQADRQVWTRLHLTNSNFLLSCVWGLLQSSKREQSTKLRKTSCEVTWSVCSQRWKGTAEWLWLKRRICSSRYWHCVALYNEKLSCCAAANSKELHVHFQEKQMLNQKKKKKGLDPLHYFFRNSGNCLAFSEEVERTRGKIYVDMCPVHPPFTAPSRGRRKEKMPSGHHPFSCLTQDGTELPERAHFTQPLNWNSEFSREYSLDCLHVSKHNSFLCWLSPLNATRIQLNNKSSIKLGAVHTWEDLEWLWTNQSQSNAWKKNIF